MTTPPLLPPSRPNPAKTPPSSHNGHTDWYCCLVTPTFGVVGDNGAVFDAVIMADAPPNGPDPTSRRWCWVLEMMSLSVSACKPSISPDVDHPVPNPTPHQHRRSTAQPWLRTHLQYAPILEVLEVKAPSLDANGPPLKNPPPMLNDHADWCYTPVVEDVVDDHTIGLPPRCPHHCRRHLQCHPDKNPRAIRQRPHQLGPIPPLY
ncbi:hypothetical protein EDD85DRAFT_945108 [Armillaria nabsnona]|nr:hypothetical protein EDD85DRAFT_945108 [Armillaria nabsnona]